MPSPTTVWLFRPGRVRESRGLLSIEDGALWFVADDGERLRVEPGSVQRVRRHRGTPVLEIRYRRDEDDRVALFFFVEPPPHPELQAEDVPPTPGRWAGRRGKAREMARLRAEGKRFKRVIQEWARAVGEI